MHTVKMTNAKGKTTEEHFPDLLLARKWKALAKRNGYKVELIKAPK